MKKQVGAVIGTLAAGFVMIPLLGIQTTIVITALLNIGLGITILVSKKYLSYKYLSIIIIVVGLFIATFPNYDVESVNFGVYAHHRPDMNSKTLKVAGALSLVPPVVPLSTGR